MLEKNLTEQLKQLQAAGLRGVWAGDLADKCSTRKLVRRGLADNGANGGRDASGLSRVFINKAGKDALAAAA